MYCTNCGSEFEGNFCPECGQKSIKKEPDTPEQSQTETVTTNPVLEPAAAQTQQPNPQIKKKKKKSPGCIVAIIVFVIIALISLSLALQETAKPLINADSLSGFTTDDVVEKYGQPANIENWNYTNANSTHSLTTYTYEIKNLVYEFIFFKNELARLTIRSDNKKISYKNSTFEDFLGVKATEDATLNDTGTVYRLNNLGGKVKDLWVINTDTDNETFSEVKLTYNTYVFEE